MQTSAAEVTTDELAGGRSKATLRVVEGGAEGTAGALLVTGSVDGGLPYAWSGWSSRGTAWLTCLLSKRRRQTETVGTRERTQRDLTEPGVP